MKNVGSIQVAVVDVVGVGCGASDGAISLDPQNGEGPYEYSWASASGTVTGTAVDIPGSYTIVNLPTGDYQVSVSDVNDCETIINQINLPAVADLEPVIAQLQHVDCFNNSNGMIEVSISGGVAPYQFSWSNGFSQISLSGVAQIDDLSGGVYSVTVSDDNGCIGLLTDIGVAEPASLLSLSINEIDEPICYGEATGGIKMDVAGGNPPYTYLWNNGSTTLDLLNVGSGMYLLTVTDVNNCEAISVPVTISEPEAIEVTLNELVQSNCFGESEGSVSLQVFGGNPPLSIQWNTGATTTSINDLSAGTYQCTITDSDGCSIMSPQYVVSGPTSPVELEVETIQIYFLCGNGRWRHRHQRVRRNTTIHLLLVEWDDYGKRFRPSLWQLPGDCDRRQ